MVKFFRKSKAKEEFKPFYIIYNKKIIKKF